MARKFKSTITDWIAVQDDFIDQFNLYNAKNEYEGNISLLMVENSNEWEELSEESIFITEDDYKFYISPSIFITEDNYKFYISSEPIWTVDKIDWGVRCMKYPALDDPNKKYFYEKESAELYVEKNKPKYSDEDIEWLKENIKNLLNSNTNQLTTSILGVIDFLHNLKNTSYD